MRKELIPVLQVQSQIEEATISSNRVIPLILIESFEMGEQKIRNIDEV